MEASIYRFAPRDRNEFEQVLCSQMLSLLNKEGVALSHMRKFGNGDNTRFRIFTGAPGEYSEKVIGNFGEMQGVMTYEI